MTRIAAALVVAVATLAACGADTDPAAATAPTAGPNATVASPDASAARASTPAGSAAPAAPPSAELTEIGSFDSPVDLAQRPGDDAVYVVEQRGTVQRVPPTGEPTQVLDLQDLTDASGEQGLLGLAFNPDGTFAYVNYTDAQGHTVISEHPVADDGTLGVGDLARTVLRIEQPYSNHNGGHLTFGPDGFLYVGMGDGGSGGDPERRASDPSTLLGKLLRIDPAIADGQPYTVPADNPFVDVTGTAPEIWAMGLRNPWKFSFDADTGDLWVADVGQGEVEEIDAVPAVDGRDAGPGANFGWSAFEGDQRFNEDVTVTDPVMPVYTYTHSATGGCSVTGGVRARGDGAGALVGWYLFGDYCLGALWALPVLDDATLRVGEAITLAEDLGRITSVSAGPDGHVYVLTQEGPVFRVDA